MQSNIKTVQNDSNVDLIIYAPEFSAICSIGKRPFWGTIAIEYKPQSRLLEFESFEKWLFDIGSQSLIIEDLCRLVFNELNKVLGDISLRVTVSARTTVHAPVSATIKQGEW